MLTQEQAGVQPVHSGSMGARSLPQEFAQKVKPILDPFDALLWRPRVSVCLLLCWWPWSHLPHWRSTLCLILCVFQADFPPQCPACPSGDAWTINRALAETSKEVDAVCGSLFPPPQNVLTCVIQYFALGFRSLDIWMTQVQERRPPWGCMSAQWFAQLILGISSGGGSPCSAFSGGPPREGWRMAPKGLRCSLESTSSPGAWGLLLVVP